MPSFLRQSTAAQVRAIGPFLDDTDFKTAETGLTIANTDIKLVVNGGASANKNSGGGTHRINGVYGLTFDATDTATVGEIEVSVVVAGALPVFDKFIVVEEAVYDALFVASAPGYVVDQPVNATKVGGTTQTGGDLAAMITAVDDFVDTEVAAIKTKTDFLPSATAGAAGGLFIAGANAATSITTALTANLIGNVTGNLSGSVGSVTGAVGSVGAGGIAASTFAAGAIDATAIAADAIGASELAADAVAEIADGLLNRDMSTGTDSGSTTVRTPRQALRFLRNKWDIAAGTLTVKKEDDSTTSWTAAISSDAAAVPVIGSDPAG